MSGIRYEYGRWKIMLSEIYFYENNLTIEYVSIYILFHELN